MTQTKRYVNRLVTTMSQQIVIRIDISYKYYYLYIDPSTKLSVLYSSYIIYLVYLILSRGERGGSNNRLKPATFCVCSKWEQDFQPQIWFLFFICNTHFCYCTNPGVGFPASYVVIFPMFSDSGQRLLTEILLKAATP